MAMGGRKRDEQSAFWVATEDLPQSGGHPFYEQVNRILEGEGFDRFAEERCRKFYAEVMGRPSLAPAIYFRMLLIGYFEGIDSERGIAWRVADSLALRRFLGYRLTDSTADHSTISRHRRLIDLETHREVFTWVLTVLAKKKLLDGKTLGIDATTLEANAALRSIVRRDTREPYDEFLMRLAKESRTFGDVTLASSPLTMSAPGTLTCPGGSGHHGPQRTCTSNSHNMPDKPKKPRSGCSGAQDQLN